MYEVAKAVLNERRISEYVTCGACRELMIKPMAVNYYNIEIMLDRSTCNIIMTPEWWAK